MPVRMTLPMRLHSNTLRIKNPRATWDGNLIVRNLVPSCPVRARRFRPRKFSQNLQAKAGQSGNTVPRWSAREARRSGDCLASMKFDVCSAKWEIKLARPGSAGPFSFARDGHRQIAQALFHEGERVRMLRCLACAPMVERATTRAFIGVCHGFETRRRLVNARRVRKSSASHSSAEK